MNLREKIGTPIGRYAPDFELPGIDEQVHHLSRYLEQLKGVGVIFMCNNSPYVSSSLETLKQIQAQYQNQGFTLIGINASDTNHYPEESFSNMKKFASERELNFPYLWDSTQDVAQCFGAEKTPEAFLVDKNGFICYRGGIDNTPDGEAMQVPYLQNAIAALLAGEEISPNVSEAMGSPLKWRT